jgi:endonuclease-3
MIAARESWSRPPARRVRTLRGRLRLVYGIPAAAPHGDPVAELVLTVLSQSTNDRNRDVAYFRLRDRFACWEAVRDAPVEAVEEAIRPGGISKVKSARISDILAAIAPAGEISLDPLTALSVPDAQAYLCALPGVGRKTAACVLLFALGMRDVPVDTHVSRVGVRLGLLRPARGSRSCTTRCSRSPRAAPSWSCTSTCCDTVGEPAMPADRPAGSVPWRGCARRSGSEKSGKRRIARRVRTSAPRRHAHAALA